MKQILIRFILGCCIAFLTLLGKPMSLAASAPADMLDIDLCDVPIESIDLNNANLSAFTDCPGFYPNLASEILTHGPYETVDDVLAIPDLTDDQKNLLKANLKSFTVTEPAIPLVKRMPPRTTQPAH
jgi:photosystem II PsbU protein